MAEGESYNVEGGGTLARRATDEVTTLNGAAAEATLRVPRVKAGWGDDSALNDTSGTRPMPVAPTPAEWNGSAAPAAATEAAVTVAAPAGTDALHVTHVSGSYSAAQIGILTIEQGAAVIYRRYVHNHADLVFDRPLRIAAGTAVTARLAAPGAGISGVVNIAGYTRNA